MIDFHSDIQPKKDDHMPRSNKKKTLIHSTHPISRPIKVFFNDNHVNEHQSTDSRKTSISIVKELREFKGDMNKYLID